MQRLGQARWPIDAPRKEQGPGAAATWSIIFMFYIQDTCTKLIGRGGEEGPGGGRSK